MAGRSKDLSLPSNSPAVFDHISPAKDPLHKGFRQCLGSHMSFFVDFPM